MDPTPPSPGCHGSSRTSQGRSLSHSSALSLPQTRQTSPRSESVSATMDDTALTDWQSTPTPDPTMHWQGFQTGSGKAVAQPSAAQLQAAQRLWDSTTADSSTGPIPDSNVTVATSKRKWSPSLTAARSDTGSSEADPMPTHSRKIPKHPPSSPILVASGSEVLSSGPNSSCICLEPSSPGSSSSFTSADELFNLPSTSAEPSATPTAPCPIPKSVNKATSRATHSEHTAANGAAISAGFATAGGSQLCPPSATALAKAQKLLADIPGFELGTHERSKDSPLPRHSDIDLQSLAQLGGFATGKGQKLGVLSQQQLEQLRQRLETDTTGDQAPLQSSATEQLTKLPRTNVSKVPTTSVMDDDFSDVNLLSALMQYGGFQKGSPRPANGFKTPAVSKKSTALSLSSAKAQGFTTPSKTPAKPPVMPTKSLTQVRPLKPIRRPFTPPLISSQRDRSPEVRSLNTLARTPTLTGCNSRRSPSPATRRSAPSPQGLGSPIAQKGVTPPSLKMLRSRVKPFKSPFKAGFIPTALHPRSSIGTPPSVRGDDVFGPSTTPTTLSTIQVPTKPPLFELNPPGLQRIPLRDFRRGCLFHHSELQLIWPDFAASFLALTFEQTANFIPEMMKDVEPGGSRQPIGSMPGLTQQLRLILLARGCNSTVVTEAWVNHHYRLIVWKLASMARYFTRLLHRPLNSQRPDTLRYRDTGHFSLTPKGSHSQYIPLSSTQVPSATVLAEIASKWRQPQTVIHQLLYRYEWEFCQGHRSALRRILERDDTSQRYLVLCLAQRTVSSIPASPKATTAAPKEPMNSQVRWMLTDGWYTVHATVDEILEDAYERGRIKIGSKLATVGAKLCGPPEGHLPLETPDTVHLALHANTTRLIPWDMRLGYHARQMTIALGSINPQGGPIACIDATVEKVWPVHYLETFPDGKHLARDAHGEARAQKQFEDHWQQETNRLYAQLHSHDGQQGPPQPRSHRPLNQLENGEELYAAYCSQVDDAFMNRLSEAQRVELTGYMAELQQSRKQRIHAEIREQLSERRVQPFFKVLLRDCPGSRPTTPKSGLSQAILTLWGFGSEQQELIKVGHRYLFVNLIPATKSDHFHQATVKVYLAATRSTSWRDLGAYEPLPASTSGFSLVSATVAGNSSAHIPDVAGPANPSAAPLSVPPYSFLASPQAKQAQRRLMEQPAQPAVASYRQQQTTPRDTQRMSSLVTTVTAASAAPSSPTTNTAPKPATDASLKECPKLLPGTAVNLVGVLLKCMPQTRQLAVQQPQLVIADQSDHLALIQHRVPSNYSGSWTIDTIIGCANLTFQGFDSTQAAYLFTFDRRSAFITDWATAPSWLKRYQELHRWTIVHPKAMQVMHLTADCLDGSFYPEQGYRPPPPLPLATPRRLATTPHSTPGRPSPPESIVLRGYLQVAVGDLRPVIPPSKGIVLVNLDTGVIPMPLWVNLTHLAAAVVATMDQVSARSSSLLSSVLGGCGSPAACLVDAWTSFCSTGMLLPPCLVIDPALSAWYAAFCQYRQTKLGLNTPARSDLRLPILADCLGWMGSMPQTQDVTSGAQHCNDPTACLTAWVVRFYAFCHETHSAPTLEAVNPLLTNIGGFVDSLMAADSAASGASSTSAAVAPVTLQTWALLGCERRLLQVLLTRALQHMYCEVTIQRIPGSESSSRTCRICRINLVDPTKHELLPC